MEGNYRFEWEEFDAAGKLSSKAEQPIYGRDLVDAVKRFVEFHRDLSPDHEGRKIKITSISWSPITKR